MRIQAVPVQTQRFRCKQVFRGTSTGVAPVPHDDARVVAQAAHLVPDLAFLHGVGDGRVPLLRVHLVVVPVKKKANGIVSREKS